MRLVLILACPLSSSWLLVSLSLSKEMTCLDHWAPEAGESGWTWTLGGDTGSAFPATTQVELDISFTGRLYQFVYLQYIQLFAMLLYCQYVDMLSLLLQICCVIYIVYDSVCCCSSEDVSIVIAVYKLLIYLTYFISRPCMDGFYLFLKYLFLPQYIISINVIVNLVAFNYLLVIQLYSSCVARFLLYLFIFYLFIL